VRIYILIEQSVQELSPILNSIKQFFSVFTFKFNQPFCHIDLGASDFSCYFIVLRKFHRLTIRKRIQHILQGEQ